METKVNNPSCSKSKHSCACDATPSFEDKHNHSDHNHTHEGNSRVYLSLTISFTLLVVGIVFDHFIHSPFFDGYLRIAWYILAFIPVAYPVMKEALQAMSKGDFFNEFSLMTIATVGALCIREYPEAVAVMLFYSVGEMFQDRAVRKAQNNIKDLLDMRSDIATVLRDGVYVDLSPEKVEVGDKIQVKVGEKVPLDGLLLSSGSSFDTSALTGESKPSSLSGGGVVLAGMLNLGKVIEVEVTKKYADSSLSRILAMVQDATSRKAKTELLIRRFAKIYTPIVFALALAVVCIPYLFLQDYEFNKWLYRALVFLVISCPCALVISVPLGYFGGIGAASRKGILFKGANFLDIMAKVNTVVMDKTGTLTKGVFKVQSVVAENYDESKLIQVAKAIESHSAHPIARAITDYRDDLDIRDFSISDVEEIAGHGLRGYVNGEEVLAGNAKLLQKFNVSYDHVTDTIVSSIVLFAINNLYVGYITIADEIKEDASQLISNLHQLGVTKTVMLSGDKSSIVNETANQLGIDLAYGELLPQDKLSHVEELKRDKTNVIAFVGDGINDTPVLALSDVGIAMGGMGSDAAIEVADVIIQTDQPSKIITAIKIARSTKSIVIQNIILAIVVKVLVMFLGIIDVASMWEAVFADVGVTIIAVLNAVRILRMKF